MSAPRSWREAREQDICTIREFVVSHNKQLKHVNVDIDELEERLVLLTEVVRRLQDAIES